MGRRPADRRGSGLENEFHNISRVANVDVATTVGIGLIEAVWRIVGDIEDEHDSAEQDQWSEESPGTYAINARTDIRDFEEAEGVHLLIDDWEEDIDTFGGLVFMLTGRVPARGEVIAHPDGHEFEIIDADPRRVCTAPGYVSASSAASDGATSSSVTTAPR